MKARTTLTAAAIAAAAAFPIPALATTHDSSQAHAQHHAGALTDGEVRRVDKDARKVTLRHGPIANLDMPPMTMVFQVQDPAMLERLKVGDKVRFNAEKLGGAYTVTQLEPVQ